jgi:hypothetical protein
MLGSAPKDALETNAKDAVVFCAGSTFLPVLKILLGLAFVGWHVPPAFAQTPKAPTYTYTYTGNPLASTNGGCNGCNVTGSFTLSQPLSANMGTLSSGSILASPVPFLVSFSFSAGSITITDQNASIVNSGIVVTTDSTGAITDYGIHLFLIDPTNYTEWFIGAASGGDAVTYSSCTSDPCTGWISKNPIHGSLVGPAGGDIRAATAPFTASQTFGPVTITWSPPFPDTNYTAVCTVETTPSSFFLPVITSRSPGSITVNPTDGGSAGGVLDCIGVPDTDVSHVIHARQTFSGSPGTVTATWSPVYPDPTYELNFYYGNATPACSMETEDSSYPGLTSLITANYGSSFGTGIIVATNFADGTLHCIEVPDFDQAIVRGSRTPIVPATSTTQITWSVPFAGPNYAAGCSLEVDGAGATVSDAVIAILGNSKSANSMAAIPGLPNGTVNCVALTPPAPPPPPPTSCNFGPGSILYTAFAVDDVLSADQRPTGIIAQFSPTAPDGTPMSLQAAADSCGFTEFDWQQTIVNWPAPTVPSLCAQSFSNGSHPCLETPSGSVLTAPPAFSDPPPGGYIYTTNSSSIFYEAYPFYYNQTAVPTGCAFSQINGQCNTLITTDEGNTLIFFDAPRNPLLPAGDYMGFTTNLVGVLPDNTLGPVLATWSWISTYNGDTGGVTETASTAPPNGSGTGGVTITSINGVPQTPPSATCTATPTVLWPPNGASVSVAVSGTVIAGTSALVTTSYSVTDSYGQDQPRGPVSLQVGGSYSFSVPLTASRNGNDKNGRTYTIYVRGQDKIGNVGVCSAVVTVPHDQGNN